MSELSHVEEAWLPWLSTTGGGAVGPLATFPGQCAVELQRTAESANECRPERVPIGAGYPAVVTLGRHEENTVVLTLRGASKIHCQLALRTFKLPERAEIHEALFLRDVSKNKTLVNGMPAFRPWHWVQHGDSIGLHPDSDKPDFALELYKVWYRKLHKLPSNHLTMEDTDVAGQFDAVPFDVAGQFDVNMYQPLAGPAVETGDVGRRRAAPASRRGRGGAGARRGAGRNGGRGGCKRPVRLGDEICGRVIDLSYLDPPATYRVRVISYDLQQGWHICDSEGLSTWDGESFTDEVDLNQMSAQGLVTFVEEPFKPPATAKRARGHV